MISYIYNDFLYNRTAAVITQNMEADLLANVQRKPKANHGNIYGNKGGSSNSKYYP